MIYLLRLSADSDPARALAALLQLVRQAQFEQEHRLKEVSWKLRVEICLALISLCALSPMSLRMEICLTLISVFACSQIERVNAGD